jgi:AICAR transformylase/IMP cyclohydrolase PurH
VGAEIAQSAESKKLDETHRRVVKAVSLFHSVREKMRGKTSIDFPAILETVLKRRPSDDELAELGYKPDRAPEELIKQLWYALAALLRMSELH